MKININLINKIFSNEIKIKKKVDKIKLSKYYKVIPMYDIYSEKIYPIENINLHYRLKECHYRFVNNEIYNWIKNKIKKTKNDTILKKLKNNLEIIENYDLKILEETSYNTLYKYSKELGLLFSICKRNSFHPYLRYLKPYYSKLELIKSGKNNKILKNIKNINIFDEKIHYKICKIISKNDISREEIKKSNLNIINNKLISLLTYYSFFGSFKFNNFLRNQEKEKISKFEYENIKKITNLIKDSPKLEKDYYFYRFLSNDDFLEKLKIGDNFIDPGFLSTTRDPFYNPNKIKDSFGFVLIKIFIPKKKGCGIFIENFSLFKNEKEFLLPPYSKLKLISKNDKFEYYHTNDDFQKLISKKYEFKLVDINYNKINNLKISNNNYPEINLLDLEFSRDNRIDMIRDFIHLTNNVGEFLININNKKFIFNYEWFDSTNTYSNFFYNKTKNGIIFLHYKNGYPLISIECGNEIVINYIKKFYHNDDFEDLEEDDIYLISSLFGKVFKYKDIKIYPTYSNFSNIENYKHKKESDDDYDILYSDMYCYELYQYIKNRFKKLNNKNITFNFGYWKLDNYMKNKVPVEINKKLSSNLKNLTWKELFIKIVENYYFLYNKLESWMNQYLDNIIDKNYYNLNIKEYLKSKNIEYFPSILLNETDIKMDDKIYNKIFKNNLRIVL
jgi:hypothetical protein